VLTGWLPRTGHEAPYVAAELAAEGKSPEEIAFAGEAEDLLLSPLVR
jgi:hypothetical protein